MRKYFYLSPNQILVLGFLLVIIIGTFLLHLTIASSNRQVIPWIDALFTSTSATCVTGLIVLDTGQDFSLFGQWVILILLQIGGLGIMTFSTMFAFLLGRKITLRQRLILQESLNQFSIGGLVRFAKYILIFAFIFEFAGSFFLYYFWRNLPTNHHPMFLSVFHAVSAFCNAGFSLFSDSLVQFNTHPFVNIIFIGLIIIGGLGFLVLLELYEYPIKKKLSLHSKIVLQTSFILVFFGAGVIYFLESSNLNTIGVLSFPWRIMGSFFQSITARTAGFNTLATSSLSNASLFFIIVLMFIGASPSSTGGGIKTTTFSVILLDVFSTLREKHHLNIYKRRIPMDVVKKAWEIVLLSLLWIIVMLVLLSHVEKFRFIELFFELISAIGTVGLSTGITSSLSLSGKIIIILTMFFGRLGPLALAFSLVFKRKPELIEYPEENLIVG